MHKFLMSFMLLGLAFLFTGCSTVSGVGEDIQKVGDAITDGAEEVETEIKKN